MLFFFELFLFVLVMLTLALGEFVSRGLALSLWLVVTALALGGYFLARGTLAPLLAGEAGTARMPAPPPAHADDRTDEAVVAAEAAIGDGPSPLDERWARSLLYNWRRTNVLLLLGALVVGGWYWLGA